jgi:hypothetical protein
MNVMIYSSMPRDGKVHRFAQMLKIDVATAIGHLVQLWCGVMEQAQTGKLLGWKPYFVAYHAGWKGDADKFVDALVSCGDPKSGFIDVIDGGYEVHDWLHWQGSLIRNRAYQRERREEQSKQIKKLRGYDNDTFEDLLQFAVKGLPNNPMTVKRYLKAWLAQKKPEQVRQILTTATSKGFDCISIHNQWFRDNGKKSLEPKKDWKEMVK